MTNKERKKRNEQIKDYFNLNPLNASTSENVEKMARRYKISTVQVYRIIKPAAATI